MEKLLFGWGILVLGFNLSLQAAASFGSPIVVQPSGGALSSAPGDLDGDGIAEFVTIASRHSDLPHFRIYSRTTNGFAKYDVRSPADVALRRDRFGGDLVIADIDGDGWNDIVVPDSSNGAGSGTLSWFKNPGVLDSWWEERAVHEWSGNGTGEVAEHMAEVEVGDINGDGLMDIVTRDVSHGVWVFIQIFDGIYWLPPKFVPTQPREGLALFDPDEDGDLDILLNGVWLQTPADPIDGDYIQRRIVGAEFWYPTNISWGTINDYACKVEAADFNNDGRPDFVITNSEELGNVPETSTKPLGIRVYLAPNDVIHDPWTEVILHTDHFSWHSCKVGDLDGDGDLDVVSGISQVGQDDAPGEGIVFLNDGTGHAFSPQVFATGSASPFFYNVSLADCDGDGDLDLFAPDNWNSGPIRYFPNLAPALRISREAEQVTVAWPRAIGGRLEIAKSLLAPSWRAHPGPFTTNNHLISVSEPLNDGPALSAPRYYRLNRNDAVNP